MYKYLSILLPFIIILLLPGLSACNRGDDEGPTPPDFSIDTTERFEITSTYTNGWIEEARLLDFTGEPRVVFSYHPNGYLKEYTTYRTTQQRYLELEHERDAQNRPLRSMYYDPQGEPYALLLYEDGLLHHKEIYADNATTRFTYSQGQLDQIEKISATGQLLAQVRYDYAEAEVSYTFALADGSQHQQVVPLSNGIGLGYQADSHLPVLPVDQRFAVEGNRRVNTASSSSLTERSYFDLRDLVTYAGEYTLSDDFERRFDGTVEAHWAKSFVNYDFYRNVYEQYPFVERTAYIARFLFADQEYFIDGSTVGLYNKAEELQAADPSNFERLYGSGFMSRYYTGKHMIIVGTVRNLPTNEELRDQLIDIADRYFLGLVNGVENTTAEEQALLDNVFYELKAHSPQFEDPNGMIIPDQETLDLAFDIVDQQAAQIIYREYDQYF